VRHGLWRVKRKLSCGREEYEFLHQIYKMKMGRAVGLAELLTAPPFLASTSSSGRRFPSPGMHSRFLSQPTSRLWISANYKRGQVSPPRPRHQRHRRDTAQMEALAPVKETLFIALIHGYPTLRKAPRNCRFRGGEDTFGDLPAVFRNAWTLANNRHCDGT